MHRITFVALFLPLLTAAACGSGQPPPGTTQPVTIETPAPAATPSGEAGEPPVPDALVPLPAPPDLDLEQLARTLGRTRGDGAAIKLARPGGAPQAGQSEQFWLVDLDQHIVSRITATLKLVSPNAYWYVENGASVGAGDLQEAAKAFEERILPTVGRSFGPRDGRGLGQPLTVLHARLRGAAGYFSGLDGYPQSVHPYSNERMMVYMNTRGLRAGSKAYQAVLSHELQHAFHFDADRDEDTWVNEGLSEFAAESAGFSNKLVEGFVDQPGTSLTEWALDPQDPLPNYGGAGLFFRYLFGRYGGMEGVRDFMEEPSDGIAGVDAYLAQFGASYQGIFADWLVANLLGQKGEGRFQYAFGEEPPPRVKPQRTLSGLGRLEGEVQQFGAEYVTVRMEEGNTTLRFQGADQASLLPTGPHSGDACWWSNRGDSIQSALVRPVDLQGLSAATLRFWVWFDLEAEWDYAYVQVSTDGGASWNILPGKHTTPANPVGNSYGPGFTGSSGGWLQEEVDLTPYAGSQMLLRFQYVTDEALNSHGLFLDDFSIPELGWEDDAESDGGWTANGFVRTSLRMPQRYSVQLVAFMEDGGVGVRSVPLDDRNSGALRLEGFGAGLREVVVIVAPVTAPTRVPAGFTMVLEGS
ncbi:MAG: hypothetical protein EXR48_06170 [Dehalococcoidia bacterium]|nr:hypothetical protein [Dehalococcoidia bacterium]